MEKIILDFTNCKDSLDLHQIWREALKSPEYYGNNFDALWDCINYLFDDPTLLELHGVAKLESTLGKDRVKIMMKILKDMHEETPWVIYTIVS